jgi:hypothetical protein
MNDLQKYLALRGITASEIAQATGCNYHSVQKTIKGVRLVKTVQPHVAGFLGMRPEQLWGQGATQRLRRLIREEIDRRAEGERARLTASYLRDNAAMIPNKRMAGNA